MPYQVRYLNLLKKGGVVLLLGTTPEGSPEKGMKDALIISQMNADKAVAQCY